MSDHDPVIAALARCRLPDGVTSIDAQAVAGIVRTRLGQFETPEQHTRTLEQLTEGNASFALIDIRGDYMVLVINSDTYDSREVGQFHRSSVDEHGRLSSFWTTTVHGPWLEPPTAGRFIAVFAGLAVATAIFAIVGVLTYSCRSTPDFVGWAYLLTVMMLIVIVVTTSKRKGPARTVLCTATGIATSSIFVGMLGSLGCSY